jgi:hypothetical protein
VGVLVGVKLIDGVSDTVLVSVGVLVRVGVMLGVTLIVGVGGGLYKPVFFHIAIKYLLSPKPTGLGSPYS